MKRLLQTLSALIILSLLLVASPVPAARAVTTRHVTKTADTNDGTCDSDCSLREALAAAGSGDTIVFDVTGTITLALGQLAITQSVSVEGPTVGTVAINAHGVSRIFGIASGTTVTLRKLTLENGFVDGANGGAILNAGDLTLVDMLVFNNTATDTSCSSSCSIYGGAIYSSGPLSISGVSTLSGNSASSAGGGIFFDDAGGSLSLSNLTISGNSAVADHSLGAGGGVYLNASTSATIDASTGFSGNTAYGAGGGMFVVSSATINSTFFDNSATNGSGGAIEVGGGTATVSGAYFLQNDASSFGGAIRVFGGTLSLDTSTLDTNSVSSGYGGGLNVNTGGSATVSNSTFTGNSAQSGGGVYANGGASFTILNSTLSGNSASAYGGGVYSNGMPVTFINDTISGNSASTTGGGLYQDSTGTLKLSNTILANSTLGGDCSSLVTLALGSVDNLIEANDLTNPCGPPAATGDPNLSPLASNGGTTQTMALNWGSPAIDAGDNTTCADASTVNNKDQRGQLRPVDGDLNGTATCDIGAYEFTVPPTNVYINGSLMGTYLIAPEKGARDSYSGANGGPVQVSGPAGSKTMASERFIYAAGTGSDHRSGTPTSYSELMGFPGNRLTTDYWFPWYNNYNMWSQLRFGNPSASQSTTVSVHIGTTLLGSYTLGPTQSMRVDYPGVNGGPLQITSSGGVPIIAAERVIYSDGNGTVQNGNHTSYYELMGFPDNQLTTEYWIPWYNNVNMWSQLRFANPSPSLSTTISVYQGASLLGSYSMGPATSTRVDFPGVNGGPLRIVSSGGVNIIAAERVIYSVGGVQNGTHTSYSELMAVPGSLLNSTYWFPSYSYPNIGTWSQLRFGNPSSSLSTTVQVYLAGSLLGTYPLGPSASTRVDFLGQDSGPMEVTTTDARSIIAAVRVIQSVSGTQTSYAEVTGIPDSQLTNSYWFPWYNNFNFDTQLRMAVP